MHILSSDPKFARARTLDSLDRGEGRNDENLGFSSAIHRFQQSQQAARVLDGPAHRLVHLPVAADKEATVAHRRGLLSAGDCRSSCSSSRMRATLAAERPASNLALTHAESTVFANSGPTTRAPI